MFPALIGDMGLSPLQIGGVVSAFVAGYGIAHVPGGMLAERVGLRAAILLGIAIEAIGVVLTAAAHGYGALLVGRLVCGVGGSVYIGSAVGLTTAWFRDRELATANGLIAGVAFSVGAAIGLFGWGLLAAAIGWRLAILAGAAAALASLLLLAAAYPHPPVGDRPEAAPGHSLASLRRVVGSERLWIMSLAFFGGYGSYFTAVAMIPGYAVERLHVDAATGHLLGAILLLSGIVGSLLGGWLSDRVLGLLPTFLLACTVEALALLAVPHVGIGGLELAAGLVGASTILGFVSWIGLPGLMRTSLRSERHPHRGRPDADRGWRSAAWCCPRPTRRWSAASAPPPAGTGWRRCPSPVPSWRSPRVDVDAALRSPEAGAVAKSGAGAMMGCAPNPTRRRPGDLSDQRESSFRQS